jgi:hypothetical protein
MTPEVRLSLVILVLLATVLVGIIFDPETRGTEKFLKVFVAICLGVITLRALNP